MYRPRIPGRFCFVPGVLGTILCKASDILQMARVVYAIGMSQIINWVLGRGTKDSSRHEHDMNDVMRRVDAQIGRAVERLSDR